MKRIYTLLLCGLFVCAGVFIETADIYAANEGHWAQSYLYNLVEQEIMRGDENGELNPDDYITRAEFVTMMNRAFKYSNKGKISFKDVAETDWYYDDISIAKTQGYFTGLEKNEAGPEVPLRREEAVTLLCRALKIEGVSEDNLQFSDSRSFSAYSKEYINAVVEKEFMTGYPDETFRPSNYMTRGEMAKVLSEVAGEIVKDEGSNYIGYANGNVSIVKTGSNLKDTIIPGDLYITAGMGTGYTHLDNVVVNGDLIISGTGNAESGEISVILEDCDINHLIINSQSSNIMSVRAEGGSVIENTTIRSNAYLEEANSKGIAFKDVVLDGPAKTTLSLAGSFENVVIKGQDNKFSLDKGTIESLTVDEDAVKGSVFIEKDALVYALYCDTATTVTGTGEIEEIVINADGCNISMLPEHIYIRPGVTATIAGKKMTHLDGEANNADPEFMDGYPRYMDLQSTSVKLLAKVNKPGKLYWAVKNVDLVNAGMSVDDVKSPDKRYVVKSGSLTVVGEKEVTINVTGLKSGVNYEYYMVFEDLKEECTKVEGEAFTTVDVVAPKLLNGTPKISSVSKDSFTVTAMPSKNVSLFWAILPNKAVSPTAESLAELKVSGALGKGEISGCEMNMQRDIVMKGVEGVSELTELTKYDIYIVLRDESDNLSKLYKVMGTTGDQTKPEFMDGYPWAEPSQATALKIRHMETEAGTLYWAVYDFDAKFPPVDDYNTIIDVEKRNELAIRAITTGQKAVKSGKATVKEKTDALLTISGLAKATPYDVYFVIMDKSGNYSDWTSLKGLKTTDKEAPKATMVFDKVMDGNPMVNANITIQFDEIVYYDGTGDDKDIRLSLLETDAYKSQKTKILAEMFSLHDLLSQVKPDYYKNINFDKVIIGEESGKTLVTFPQAAFGRDGVGLDSGGQYQFELNNVTDSDGNAINQATLLTKFKIVAPQIYVSTYTGNQVFEDNQIAFTYTPTGGVNSDKLLDVMFQTNRNIKTDLAVYKDVDTNGDGITDTEQKLTQYGFTGKSIAAGQARSVGLLSSEYYEKFANINQPLHFVLTVTSLESVPSSQKNSWDGSLEIQTIGVIGIKQDLRNLGRDIESRSNPLDYIKNYSETVVVTNPDVFKIKRTYTDTAQPELVQDLDFEVFDTAVNVHAMTDKTAKLYYVTFPEGAHALPDRDQILEGLPQYSDCKQGVIDIAKGLKEYEELIEGLTPDTKYVFNYVLLGKDQDGAVATTAAFKTLKPTTPELVEYSGGLLRPTGISTDTTVEMQGKANTDAKFYWIMKVSGVSEGSDKGCGLDQDGKTAAVPYTPKELITLADTDNTLVARGVFDVDREEPFNFMCEGMDSTTAYDVFGTLVSDYSDVVSDHVYVYRGIRSKDINPPEIVSFSTSVRQVTPTPSGITDSDGNPVMINNFTGTVSVLFDEGLYFKNTGGGSGFKPLTANAVVEGDGTTKSTVKNGALFQYDAEVDLQATLTTTSDGNAVRGFVFYFEKLVDGNSIDMIADLYDQNGNQVAGKLVLTFEENTASPLSSKFTVDFK